MQESATALYEEAMRFDEGTLYQSKEYGEIFRTQECLLKLMEEMYGAKIYPLLQAYTETFYESTEMECRHYFEQGYLLGAAERKR